MRKLWLLGLLVATGCASAPIKKTDLTALAAADALVLDGCYDCLLEARATYERVGVGQARPLVIVRLFETQLLLTLRERELALDSAASLARARDLAKELPPVVEADRYLALADFPYPDNVGTPRREARSFRIAHQSFVSKITSELEWLKTTTAVREPVRQYLALAVDCASLARAGRPGPLMASQDDLWTGSVRSREAPAGTPPLVAYRIGMCDAINAKGLESVRIAVPRFAEAAFFLARLEVANAQRTGAPKARDLLAEYYKRFPTSPAGTYLSANYNQLLGECRDAIRFYDETIALKPIHEDALLGRTMCLAYLRRFDEAIAQATRMIELQTDNWGQAFYWRAWVYHAQGALPPARADIERAKTLDRADKSFMLAGMIEHDQDDLDIAERDLKLAKQMNPAQCVAMWYLGLVNMKRQQWLPSAGHFEDAMGCYKTAVAEDERSIKEWEARDTQDPAFKARQIANFKAALVEDQKQLYAAAFNAANFSAQGGNVPHAKELIEIAAKDPALADKVAQLREILKDQ